tara:strand:+ start:4599 stop:5084 length:486 start_codon:yes stop_codon:yes gene_type:complete
MTSETYKPGMVPADYKHKGGKWVVYWDYPRGLLRGLQVQAFDLYQALDEYDGDPSLLLWKDIKQFLNRLQSLSRMTFQRDDDRAFYGNILFDPGPWQNMDVIFDCIEPMTYSEFASKLYDLADQSSKMSIMDARFSDIQRAVAVMELMHQIDCDSLCGGEL